jgi:hypothetical protein
MVEAIGVLLARIRQLMADVRAAEAEAAWERDQNKGV